MYVYTASLYNKLSSGCNTTMNTSVLWINRLGIRSGPGAGSLSYGCLYTAAPLRRFGSCLRIITNRWTKNCSKSRHLPAEASCRSVKLCIHVLKQLQKKGMTTNQKQETVETHTADGLRDGVNTGKP